MKLPRDLSGDDVAKGLRRVRYETVRQKGDHAYMTTKRNGEHHVSIPLHRSVKVGTLNGILTAVAVHLAVTRDELLREMRI